MAKLTFSLPHDDKVHQYCLSCGSQDVHRVFRNQRTYCYCNTCRKELARALVIDPEIVWWKDERTLEYWHESVGVFLHTAAGRILLFERTIFPFALTIPAGHLDRAENPDHAVLRELHEEIGIDPTLLKIRLFSNEDVIGDSCRRGADSHRWHLYTSLVDNEFDEIRLNDEGKKPVWLTIDKAMNLSLTFATRYFLEKYGSKLLLQNMSTTRS